MQITFNPKDADLTEAGVILGMLMPSFVKGCKDQGDTLAEVQAGIADLVSGTWNLITEPAADSEQEG